MDYQIVKGKKIECTKKDQNEKNAIYFWTIKLSNNNTYYYVGKTKQSVYDRNYQHLKKITKEYKNFNKLDLFLKDNINSIESIKVKVIDKALNDKELNDKEIMHTKTAKDIFGIYLLNVLNV